MIGCESFLLIIKMVKMIKKILLLIDIDLGVDDVLVLLMVFVDECYVIVGLIIVVGNVGLDYMVCNVLKLCEVVGCDDVLVFVGCVDLLLYFLVDVVYVYGVDGFGDVNLLFVVCIVEVEYVVLVILCLLYQYVGELFLVVLGLLINVVLVLKFDFILLQCVKCFLVMGGVVICYGNIILVVEFNIVFDLEVVYVVFIGFLQIEVVDWEVIVVYGLLYKDVE